MGGSYASIIDYVISSKPENNDTEIGALLGTRVGSTESDMDMDLELDPYPEVPD